MQVTKFKEACSGYSRLFFGTHASLDRPNGHTITRNWPAVNQQSKSYFWLFDKFTAIFFSFDREHIVNIIEPGGIFARNHRCLIIMNFILILRLFIISNNETSCQREIIASNE